MALLACALVTTRRSGYTAPSLSCWEDWKEDILPEVFVFWSGDEDLQISVLVRSAETVVKKESQSRLK